MDVLKNKLPLCIKEVEWNETAFYMGGVKWNYNSFADWSVVDNEAMIIGCHDDNIQSFIKENIMGAEIIALRPSLDLPSYDPIFILSNNISIKFFSTSIVEPWTCKIDNNCMFVASPSDVKWILSI